MSAMESRTACTTPPLVGWRHRILSMGMADAHLDGFWVRYRAACPLCLRHSIWLGVSLLYTARMEVLRDTSCRSRILSRSQSITCGPSMARSIYWMCVPWLHDRPVFDKFPRMSSLASLASLASPRTGLPVQFRSLLPCLIHRLCKPLFTRIFDCRVVTLPDQPSTSSY